MLAVIGDVHHHMDRLSRVLERAAAYEVAGLLQVGDIGSSRILGRGTADPARIAAYRDSVAQVLAALRAVGPTLWVPGNHDLRDWDDPGMVDGRVVDWLGLRVGGIGGAGPDRYGFPYEWSEAEIRARPALDCDVLISHAPPKDTRLDHVHRRDVHVGSAAIRERAADHRLLVCGHIHESAGSQWLGDCLCLNAGGLGEPHGAARLGLVRWGPEGPEEAWVEVLDDPRA